MVSTPVKFDSCEHDTDVTPHDYHEYVKEKLSFLSCPTWKSDQPDELHSSAVYAKIKHEADIVDKRFKEETAGDMLAGVRFDIDRKSFQKFQEETVVEALYPALDDYRDKNSYWSVIQAVQDEQKTYWNDIKTVGFGRKDKVSTCSYSNPFDPSLTFSGLGFRNDNEPKTDTSSSASTENLFLAAENSIWILEDYLQKYKEYLASMDSGSLILDEAIKEECKLEELLAASPIPSPVCEIGGDKDLENLIDRIQSAEVKSIWERPVPDHGSPIRSNPTSRLSDVNSSRPAQPTRYKSAVMQDNIETRENCDRGEYECFKSQMEGVDAIQPGGFVNRISVLLPEIKTSDERYSQNNTYESQRPDNGVCSGVETSDEVQRALPSNVRQFLQSDVFATCNLIEKKYSENVKEKSSSTLVQREIPPLLEKGQILVPSSVHDIAAVTSGTSNALNVDSGSKEESLVHSLDIPSPGTRLRPTSDPFYPFTDEPLSRNLRTDNTSSGRQVEIHQRLPNIDSEDNPSLYHSSQQTTAVLQNRGNNIPSQTYQIQPRYTSSGYEFRLRQPALQAMPKAWPAEFSRAATGDNLTAGIYSSYSGYNCPASGTLRYPTAYGGTNNSNVNVGYTANDLQLIQQQRLQQNKNSPYTGLQAYSRIATNYKRGSNATQGVLSPVKSRVCHSVSQNSVPSIPYISLYPQYSRIWANSNNSADDSWHVESTTDFAEDTTTECVNKIKVHITDMYSSINVISNNRDQVKNALRHAQHFSNKSNLIEIVPTRLR